MLGQLVPFEEQKMKAISINELQDVCASHEKWLKSHGMEGHRAVFTKRSIKGIDLSGLQLLEAKFLEVDFTGSCLRGANLSKSVLNKCNLQGCDLRDCDLSSGSVVESLLSSATLSGSSLIGTSLSSSKVDHCDFCDCVAMNANLNRTQCQEANFSRVNGVSTKFFNSNLYKAVFDNADFSSADFSNANLDRASFYSTVLSAASFINSKVRGGVFSRSNLWEIQKDSWDISGAVCTHVFIDPDNAERYPVDRDFREGEFERIFAWLPSFRTEFKDLTPFDPLVISLIVDSINENHPKLKVEVEALSTKGIAPYVSFTVGSMDQLEEARAIAESTIKTMRPILLNELRQQLSGSLYELRSDVSKMVKSMSVEKLTVSGNVGQIITGDSPNVNITNHVTQSAKELDLKRVRQLLEEVDAKQVDGQFSEKVKNSIKKELKQVIAGEVRTLSKSVIESIKSKSPELLAYVTSIFG